MAKIPGYELHEGKEWEAWYGALPPRVRAVVDRCPPDRLYRIKDSGHRGPILNYREDGTVTLTVPREYNFLDFERNVIGLTPDDIEECDLPAPGEPLGVLYTERADVERLLAEMQQHHLCDNPDCAMSKPRGPGH